MNLKYIKKYLFMKVGSNITVVYYGSRKKKEVYQGILFKVYDNVFTIILSSGEIKSFNYIDVLTKNIQIYI